VQVGRDPPALELGRVDRAPQQPLALALRVAEPAHHRTRQRQVDELE
jgi:hypothetical protein